MIEANVEQLIRAPVTTTFDAFVDPATITQFWLERTTGPLGPGLEVEWHFMVPGASDTVRVTEFRQDRAIAFRWSDGVSVSMTFSEVEEGQTRLAVGISGFETTSQAVNATEGFTIVLCDLKTLLEGGRSANLVRDKAALIARS